MAPMPEAMRSMFWFILGIAFLLPLVVKSRSRIVKTPILWSEKPWAFASNAFCCTFAFLFGFYELWLLYDRG